MKRALPALALLVAFVVSACGGGDVLSFDAVAQAADRTAAERTARFEMSVQMHAPGVAQPMRIFSAGALDYERSRVRMDMDMGDLARVAGQQADLRMSLVFAGGTMYMKLPPLMAASPTPWMSVDVARGTGLSLGELGSLGQNPADQLELLRAVGKDVDRRGTKVLRGVETTHYHAELDLQAALEQKFDRLPAEQRDQLRRGLEAMADQAGVKAVPVDVYLDAGGVLHRMVLDMAISLPGAGDDLRAVTTLDMFDFGKPVEIAPPPAGEVTEVTEQTAAALGLGG